MTLEPLTNREASPRLLTMTMVLDPGEYTLRLAAIEHDGKSGSVHHTFDARLHRHRQRRRPGVRSDDVVGSRRRRRAPANADGGHHSETMYAILELSGDSGRVGKSRVTVQVAESETAPALVSAEAQPLRGVRDKAIDRLPRS